MPFIFESGPYTVHIAQTDDVDVVQRALERILRGRADCFSSADEVIHGPATATLFFVSDFGDIQLPENGQRAREISFALMGQMYHHDNRYPERLRPCSVKGVQVAEVNVHGHIAALVSAAWV